MLFRENTLKKPAKALEKPGALRVPLIVNAAFFLLILFLDGLYFSSKYWSESGALHNALKACASLAFVVCSCFNLCLAAGRRRVRRSAVYCGLLFAGQVFACAGDIALNYDFVTGAALFATGHILFLPHFARWNPSICGRRWRRRRWPCLPSAF